MDDYTALRARLAEPDMAGVDVSNRVQREDAFAELAAETVTRDTPVEILRVVRHLAATGALGTIQAAATDTRHPAHAAALGVTSLLRTLRDYGETHVDLRSGTADRAALDALVPALLDAAARDAVVALGTVTEPRWPGLREGDLQNARHTGGAR